MTEDESYGDFEIADWRALISRLEPGPQVPSEEAEMLAALLLLSNRLRKLRAEVRSVKELLEGRL